MAQTIAIANHKGGVGKTTTAVNIGAGLAQRGYKTLLVDMDAQANLTDTLHVTHTQFNVYDIMKGEAEALPVMITPALHVIPAVLDLATAEVELCTAIGREKLLAEALQPLQMQYDYIIIDTAPTLGLLTINALTAADVVIIPMQAEYYALKGVKGLTDVIANVQRRINSSLRIGGVIITQYDTRTTLHKQLRDTIAAQFGEAMFNTSVRNCIAVAEAQAKGSDIFAYDDSSAGAEDYRNIVEEIIQRFPRTNA